MSLPHQLSESHISPNGPSERVCVVFPSFLVCSGPFAFSSRHPAAALPSLLVLSTVTKLPQRSHCAQPVSGDQLHTAAATLMSRSPKACVSAHWPMSYSVLSSGESEVVPQGVVLLDSSLSAPAIFVCMVFAVVVVMVGDKRSRQTRCFSNFTFHLSLPNKV